MCSRHPHVFANAKPNVMSSQTCAILLWLALWTTVATAQTGGWVTHSHDAQHSGISSVASQPFTKIHWHTPVDLALPQGEILTHYGSPLVTPANTVIVPIKTAADNFKIGARNGANGVHLWSLPTNYQAPHNISFLPGIGPTLGNGQLFVPDSAGRILVRQTPDLATGTVTHLIFYGQKNYAANPAVYQQNVQINTPLTSDANGNLYFGFVVLGPTPIHLVSGLARIAANGMGTWVSAATISGDAKVDNIAMSCAPALSKNGGMVYVVATNESNSTGYLVAVNSTTLAAIKSVPLLDPSSGLNAQINDASSSTPTVGPDGDVYYGVLENPYPTHNSRGWLLHFNSTLTTKKVPGSFGWDDTASVVEASLVASYHGTSKYLLMTKYNNYASIGTGDGHNRIAILDPNATESDPVISNAKVMKEVITQLGVTPDPSFPGFPGAVREWCINTAAVDPITKSIIANNEDGKLYRWDLTTNTLSEKITLSTGIGEAYTPTAIGADGTVYAINAAILDAIGK
jgi:hypothetical protein